MHIPSSRSPTSEPARPPPAPLAFLANPGDGAAGLVWDEGRDASLTGYEIGWRVQGEDEWRQRSVGRGDRSQVDGLANGQRYALRIRALVGDQASPWIEAPGVEIGSVDRVSAISALGDLPVGLILRTLWYGLIHAATTS